jgi:hypothetical protein
MQKFYPEDYDFVPRTFILPKDDEVCRKAMSKNKNKAWICKPSKGSQGDGLQLIHDIWEVSEITQRDEFIIQYYIEKPLLVNSKKFDLRLYIVLYGVKKMYAYLSEEGMARFCTVNYHAPTRANKKNEYMHLTNYSLNKHSDQYVKHGGEETEETKEATKRKLTDIYKIIEESKPNGLDIVNMIKKNIQDVCNKTINAIHADVGKQCYLIF